MHRNYSLISLLSFNLLNEVDSLFCIFEISVRCRRKKFTFAISSPDDVLVKNYDTTVSLDLPFNERSNTRGNKWSK